MGKPMIGLRLRKLNNQIMRGIACSISQKSGDAVTGTNGWIICYLAGHPTEHIFQKDLESRFGITRSTASKVLSLMERKGLIIRKSVPHDARLREIVLTPKAVELNELARESAARLEARLTSGFTEEEIAVLADDLERMQKNLNRADQ